MKNEKSYITDAENLTCTCGDFRFKRRRFAANDPRRLCKHLCAAVRESSALFEKRIYFEIQSLPQGEGFPLDLRFEFNFDGHNVSIHIPPKNYQPIVSIFDDNDVYLFDVAAKKWKGDVSPGFRSDIEKWAVKMWIQQHGRRALNNIYGPTDDNWDQEEALNLAKKYEFKLE